MLPHYEISKNVFYFIEGRKLLISQKWIYLYIDDEDAGVTVSS